MFFPAIMAAGAVGAGLKELGSTPRSPGCAHFVLIGSDDAESVPATAHHAAEIQDPEFGQPAVELAEGGH